MVAIGRTVFQGDQLEEFKVHILGVLRNVIGPRRDLILARLEGGPLANTGVIAGMSGSPVYIDGRLVGAVSYSLGEFSKEPIAGITPIDEMIADATLPGQRRAQVARAELTLPVTQEGLRESLRQAFAWVAAVRREPRRRQRHRWRRRQRRHRDAAAPDCHADQLLGFRHAARSIRSSQPSGTWASRRSWPARHSSVAVVGRGGAVEFDRSPLRPGDPIGVALMNGDLEVGRNRHGDRSGRQSRLRLRPPVLQPRARRSSR